MALSLHTISKLAFETVHICPCSHPISCGFIPETQLFFLFFLSQLSPSPPLRQANPILLPQDDPPAPMLFFKLDCPPAFLLFKPHLSFIVQLKSPGIHEPFLHYFIPQTDSQSRTNCWKDLDLSAIPLHSSGKWGWQSLTLLSFWSRHFSLLLIVALNHQLPVFILLSIFPIRKVGSGRTRESISLLLLQPQHLTQWGV